MLGFAHIRREHSSSGNDDVGLHRRLGLGKIGRIISNELLVGGALNPLFWRLSRQIFDHSFGKDNKYCLVLCSVLFCARHLLFKTKSCFNFFYLSIMFWILKIHHFDSLVNMMINVPPYPGSINDSSIFLGLNVFRTNNKILQSNKISKDQINEIW